MADVGAAELCRVTVVGDRSRLDVALPGDALLAEVVPMLLTRLVGDPRQRVAPDHVAGWALQRLGEAPIDLSASVSSAGIRHGDLLYLKPRERAAPPLTVDDVVEAIGAASADLAGRWSLRAARIWSVWAVGVLLVTGAVAAAAAGPPWPPVFLLCSVLSGLMVAVAGVASRAGGRADVALVFGVAGPAYAFVAGVAVLAGDNRLGSLGADALLVGAAAALPVAAVAALLVPTEGPAFVGVAVAAGCGLASAVAGLVWPRPGTAATVAVSLAILVAPLLPMLAYRLSGLPLPAVPTSRPELAEAGPSVSAAQVAVGAARADRMVTATLAGLCGVAAAAGAVIATVPGIGPMALLGLGAVALTLRGRHYPALAQRLAAYGAGLAMALELAYAASIHSGQNLQLALIAGIVAVALATALAGSPRRVRSPVLSRLADVIEVLVVLTVVPVAAQVFGLYAAALSLGG